jgi:hypothetical protein
MACKEPEELLDTSGDLDWLFKENGEAGIEAKKESPLRDDLTHHDPKVHATEIDDNIQWRGHPPEHRTALQAIVEKLFNVFAQEGMQNHMRGFEFNVDAGEVKPTCCRQQQHGPHESRVIVAPVEKLERKGVVKDNKGPWGSPIALASKPDQGHVNWSEFAFCLCISCRKLNTVTRPFAFPITGCNVERVGDAKCHVTADLDAGRWHSLLRRLDTDRCGKARWPACELSALPRWPEGCFCLGSRRSLQGGLRCSV